MILSDNSILFELDHPGSTGLQIKPLDRETQIQPASVDLRLGEEIYICRDDRIETYPDGPTFQPVRDGHMYLGHTQETIRIPRHLGAQLHGRSSLARQGLLVHITGGWVDPGFRGQLVLEVANLSNEPIHVPIGQRVCQLTLSRLTTSVDEAYGEKAGSKYMDQEGIVTSRLEDDNDS